MSELLPCPFCGGEAHTRQTATYCWTVECITPFCGCEFAPYGTEAEAIAAWNTRVERTCKWTLHEQWQNAEGNDYVYGFKTECGAQHTWWPDSLPNYCPNCGKAVKQ